MFGRPLYFRPCIYQHRRKRQPRQHARRGLVCNALRWVDATFRGQNDVSWGSQSVQYAVFSGAYIMTVPHYVYTRLVLRLCGSSGPSGHPWNAVLTTRRLGGPGSARCTACQPTTRAPLWDGKYSRKPVFCSTVPNNTCILAYNTRIIGIVG